MSIFQLLSFQQSVAAQIPTVQRHKLASIANASTHANRPSVEQMPNVAPITIIVPAAIVCLAIAEIHSYLAKDPNVPSTKIVHTI